MVLFSVLRGSPAAAQLTGRVYRVGILASRTPALGRQFLDLMRRALSSLGYMEGKNLEIIDRGGLGDDKQLPLGAAEIVQAQPDVIVASGTVAIAAAKRATTSIPIVFTNSADPVGSGFVSSLARPGGNITGVTNMQVELEDKRLQLLKELVPHLRRVVVVRNPANPGNVAQWRETERAARTTGVQAFALDVRSADEIDAAFRTIPHLHADAIIVLSDSATATDPSHVVRLVALRRLPAIYSVEEFTTNGGLMVYAASSHALWIQAATYVDRILKGAKSADLPVERPTTFELIVNLKTAHDIGITVPQSILLRADQVIR